MDAVNAFNHELFSLMDSKPPISRAKMISITKSAIKAMKLYKHVVQIVEKFIKKCKPEYKVAGLYVVDSIVRQSRHQFGADKDVFGPRFTKNITGTFENLCLCPVEDRSKIVRVLNLWQKNGVFKIEIIQPLLDMAAANTSAAAVPFPEADESAYSPPSPKEPPPEEETPNSTLTTAAQLQTSDAFAAVAQLFQTTQGQQLQQMLQNFQQKPLKPEASAQPTQGQSITMSLGPVPPQPPLPSQPTQQSTAFAKTLLDRFDYDDEPDAGEETKKDEPSSQSSMSMQPTPAFPQHIEHFKSQMTNMSQDLSQQGSVPLNGQPQAFGLPPGQVFPLGGMIPPPGLPQMGQPPLGASGPTGFQGVYPPHSVLPQQQELLTDPTVLSESSTKDGKHSRRSHSGSRSPKRRRSRSNSRSRRSRHRRSRSRERRHHSPRSRSQERRERERDRERRQKGLPPLKSHTLSVCTTTLWVGQLDKRTQQQDVECLLEEFGQIESTNMIPPRGCAYIVMVHRQDAFRALQKLSRGNYKVNQKTIKIAWALNKGIKADFKQYWDVDHGVTYIPWSKIKEEDLDELKDGGILDIDSLAPEWSTTRKTLESSEEITHNGRTESQPEEIQVVPVLTPAVPSVPPVQIASTQPAVVAVGPVQPPVFPGPMGVPLPSFPAGVPPPFLRPGFNPLHMPPGFLPPGGMPLGPPPSKPEDPPVDPAGLGNRQNEDIRDGPIIFNHHIGPMGNLVIGHPATGPPTGIPRGPPAGLHGGPPGAPNAGLLGALPVGLHGGPRVPMGAPLGPFHGGAPVGLSGGLPGGPRGGPPIGPLGGLPGAPPFEGQHIGPPGSPFGPPHNGSRPGLPSTLPPGGLHGGPPGGPPNDGLHSALHVSAPSGGLLSPLTGPRGAPPGSLPGGFHGGLSAGPPIEGHPGAAPGGLHGGPPGGTLLGPPTGPRGAPPGSLSTGPPGGPSLEGQHVGPPSGGLLGSPPGGPRPGPPGNLHPSGGLLGARPGLIPLQRPPGLSPNMQRFPPSQGPRPPHPGAPTMDRAPHPQMHPDNSPGFPSHNARGPFPPQGHGPPQGPPSFNRPGGGPRGDPHRGMESPEEMDGRQFRGERTGFRDRESERDWDRDRERDRGFGGGRRSFGEGGRIDGRDRPSGWQDDGNPRGGWERDRGRDQDRDRERDRDRRDWRERRSSPDRDRGRDTGERRDRGRGERGSRGSRDSRDSREGDRREGDRGRSGDNKEGDRPRRSERRERSTRWDNDDRLNELENSDRSRTSDKETSSDRSHRKTNSEPLVSKGEDSKTEPSNKSNTSDTPEEKQETNS
ncbi:hypothetical protein NL108_005701 [Boleophthalmus pectinirostris]|uniref:SR-related and CTD-associated factor 4 n=1 Tax=Boleophthalmus pectinirostris TaxID=150288 RepID=UPI00242F4F18|nr:SR-related and CTD-associated factor 4 [Boleophthalmus pectinirostris]KAJ0061559.1 hypothetical protein NL108_005701 [Boleophthalmus pectinirostris]